MTYVTKLRKVGGSVMLTIPPALLETLELTAETRVGMAVKNGRLVVERQGRPRYSIDDLLSQCDPKTGRDPDDKNWVLGKRVGREII